MHRQKKNIAYSLDRMEKWKNQLMDRDKMPLMGLEIINNTPEVQSLKFFSELHRHHMHKTNLSVRSILGDTIYEDKDLSLLTHFIFDYRHLRIFATIFNTSLLYGSFKGKQFHVTEERYLNQERIELDLSKYVNEANPMVAEIESMFTIGFRTELEQTGIEAGERLLILFDLGNRNFSGSCDMVDKANHLFGAEKRKKILLML